MVEVELAKAELGTYGSCWRLCHCCHSLRWTSPTTWSGRQGMTGQTGHVGMAWHGSDHAVGSGDTLQALLEPSMMTVLESCHLTKLNLTGSAGAMVFCEAEHVCFVVGETRKDDRIELPSVFERIFDNTSVVSALCPKHASNICLKWKHVWPCDSEKESTTN